MLRRHKMIISLERDGIVSSKEVRTFLSCSGMLKHLRKQAKQTDPWAKIMELDDVPTLVCHRKGSPNKITVRLVDSITDIR
jgi:hypothetical protein